MKLRKDSWGKVKLSKVCDFVRGPFGGSLKKEIFVKSGYAVYEQQHAIYNQFESFRYFIDKGKYDEMKRFHVHEGDILMSCSGTFGKIAIVPKNSKEGVINQALLKLSCKKGLENTFFNIWLNSPSFQNKVNSSVQGTAIKNISSVAFYKEVDMLLPPLEEQKQIASLFQSLEESIEKVESQERNLVAMWLKLINDFVCDEPLFGKLLKGKKLKKVKYSEVANKLMRRIDPVNYGVDKIVAGDNLESQDFKIRSWGIVGKDVLGPAFHVLFKPKDILYGSRRTYLKKVAYAEFEGVCANTTYVIRADESVLLQDLLKHIMLSNRFTQYSIGVSKGSTNPYINWKDLDDFTFEIPDLDSQRKIANILDQILVIREQLIEHKNLLKLLKQKLLNEILG